MKPNVSAIYRQAEDLKLIELEDLMENLECLRQTKTEQEAEKLYPQAENWYQMAQFHKKSGRLPMLSYKKVVDYCRLIFEHHPESPQAEKARQLLREMPEKYQKRFNVTNEEMGL